MEKKGLSRVSSRDSLQKGCFSFSLTRCPTSELKGVWSQLSRHSHAAGTFWGQIDIP